MSYLLKLKEVTKIILSQNPHIPASLSTAKLNTTEQVYDNFTPPTVYCGPLHHLK
jgi:hypothetical protein